MIDWRQVDPALLDPRFREDLEALLGPSPFAWVVTFGFRSLAEQALLWDKYQAGGPRAAPPGKSAHNYGLAVDVVLDADPGRPGLQASWDTKHPGWVWLFNAVAAHPRLKSGQSFGDGGHIERYHWQEHAAWLGRA